ncbi:hypothetical protein AwDysgo_03440 [Bacteroidales bacterium]|nr:hypothetical protein AwDysgo_03440 [Bacteroidales bacterium]
MISIRCPNCAIGLKVDESKLPSHLESFNCPKCKKPIPVSLLSSSDSSVQNDPDTVLLSAASMPQKTGRLLVLDGATSQAQTINLREGINIIGRQTATSDNPTAINTSDKLMSREHLLIEIKKDGKDNFIHQLSDNKSKNKTLYKGTYLDSEEVVVLQDGDQIQIGQTALRFNI